MTELSHTQITNEILNLVLNREEESPLRASGYSKPFIEVQVTSSNGGNLPIDIAIINEELRRVLAAEVKSGASVAEGQLSNYRALTPQNFHSASTQFLNTSETESCYIGIEGKLSFPSTSGLPLLLRSSQGYVRANPTSFSCSRLNDVFARHVLPNSSISYLDIEPDCRKADLARTVLQRMTSFLIREETFTKARLVSSFRATSFWTVDTRNTVENRVERLLMEFRSEEFTELLRRKKTGEWEGKLHFSTSTRAREKLEQALKQAQERFGLSS